MTKRRGLVYDLVSWRWAENLFQGLHYHDGDAASMQFPNAVWWPSWAGDRPLPRHPVPRQGEMIQLPEKSPELIEAESRAEQLRIAAQNIRISGNAD